ncbi:MAG: hypothetical protein ACRDDL_06090 [Sarcina sp.]
MNDLNSEGMLSIKELSFICKYKFNSKLSEKTIKKYLYVFIKTKQLRTNTKNNQIYIDFNDFLEFLSENYIKLGFNYDPTIK